MSLIVRWLALAVALWVADLILPGISISGSANPYVIYAGMAVVFAVVGMIVKPILTVLTLPVVILTLGLFMFVINAITFMVASWVAQNWLNIGFSVDTLITALIGSVIVTVVTTVVGAIFGENSGS